jgi:hypothetical protein
LTSPRVVLEEAAIDNEFGKCDSYALTVSLTFSPSFPPKSFRAISRSWRKKVHDKKRENEEVEGGRKEGERREREREREKPRTFHLMGEKSNRFSLGSKWTT